MIENIQNQIEAQEISLPSRGRFSGRLSVGAAAFSGKLFILGGYPFNNDTDYDDCYDPKDDDATDKIDIFDPTTTLFREDENGFNLESMMEGRAGPGVCALDGKLYVIGGHSQHELYGQGTDDCDIMVTKSSVECFHFEGNDLVRSTVAPMNTRRMKPAVAGYNGKLYVIGGLEDVDPVQHTYSDSIEVYDPANNTWTTLNEKLTGGRMMSNACLIDRRLARKHLRS